MLRDSDIITSLNVISDLILTVTQSLAWAPARGSQLEFLAFDIHTFGKHILWLSFRVQCFKEEAATTDFSMKDLHLKF